MTFNQHWFQVGGTQPVRAPWRALIAGALVALGLVACGSSERDGSATSGGTGGSAGPQTGEPAIAVDLRRTTFGVAHVKAADWRSLGYGTGYAQASDNLCTIADSMLTYRGERSAFFGADARPPADSTMGQPLNIDSDFYHRHVLSAERMAAFEAAQTPDMRALVSGYTAGYNRVVREMQTGQPSGHQACAGQPWVRPLDEADVWRRMHAFMLAGGYAYFVADIANAQPPEAAANGTPQAARTAFAPSAARAAAPAAAPRKRSLHFGGRPGIGSNAYAFGQEATGQSSGLLFGNPHWYWRGPDRFYQQQLTLGERLDVSGVAVLGQPVMLIGFNNDVAWSHTVSTGRRFGLFAYALDPENPTAVMVDGVSTPLTATSITVMVRQASGALTPVQRTLYRSPQGPMVDLREWDATMGWNADTAWAVRDVNEANYRSYQSWLDMAAAHSLEALIGVQMRSAAMPWVNTLAAARSSADGWYGDIGNMPHVPEALEAACSLATDEMAETFPNVPVLDGSQTACDWATDADSVQAGSIAPQQLPARRSASYVANMNDSFWLANPGAPLEGFAPIVGATQEPQSLRTRLGHLLVRDRLSGADGYAGRTVTAPILAQWVLNSRNFSAELLRGDILAKVCPTALDLTDACAVLLAWDGRGHAQSRGAVLWQAMWGALHEEALGDALYAEPFDPERPLDTPYGLHDDAVASVRTALRAAAAQLADAGLALNVAKGDVLHSERGGVRMPLYGGCDNEGYFTILCTDEPLTDAGQSVDQDAHGNSYLQIVSFAQPDVQAQTFLAFSQSDDPASPHFGDYTQAYAQQQWHRVPFSEAAIVANPDYRVRSLRE